MDAIFHFTLHYKGYIFFQLNYRLHLPAWPCGPWACFERDSLQKSIYSDLTNYISFFFSVVDPSCLWLQATVWQWAGTGDIWLHHMDHSSQFCHSFEPFLPHALSSLPVWGVPTSLTEKQMSDTAKQHAQEHLSAPAHKSVSQRRSSVHEAVRVTQRQTCEQAMEKM